MRARVAVGAAVSAAVLAAVVAARLAIAPDGFADRDGFFFAQAVERYSLGETRPFWPGYPVFIWLARLATWLSGDVLLALHALSAVSSALSAIPMAVIAARLAVRIGAAPAPAASLAAGLWSVSPLAWAIGSQSYSEPAALLLVLSALAVALTASGRAGMAAIGALAGLALGCRPPYAELLPAIAMAHPGWRLEGGDGRRAWTATGLAFLATCALWLGWQLVSEGLPGYVAAARQILFGHVRSHGGTMATDPDVGSRIGALATNVFGHGLGASGPGAGALGSVWTVAITGSILVGGWRAFRAGDGVARRVTLALLAYGALVLVAHNVRLARFSLPLVVALTLLAALALPRSRWGTAVAAALLIAGGAASIAAVRLHAGRPVLGIEVAEWLRSRPTAYVLVATDDQYLPFYLDQRRVPWARSSPDLVRSRGDEAAAGGHDVYSTVPPPVRPEEWTLAGRWTRGGRIEPHAPRVVLLLRRGTATAR